MHLGAEEQVTTGLLILIHPRLPLAFFSPHTHSPDPPLTVCMTVLYNMRLYSMYLPLFSPSVCASQPPFLDIHPTPLRPRTAPTVRETERERERERKKKRRGRGRGAEQFQTRRHKSRIQSSPLFLSPLLLLLPLTDFITFYSSARQCPRPRRNGGFFLSLEHEKDCQIIRNPTPPTEPPPPPPPAAA